MGKDAGTREGAGETQEMSPSSQEEETEACTGGGKRSGCLVGRADGCTKVE